MTRNKYIIYFPLFLSFGFIHPGLCRETTTIQSTKELEFGSWFAWEDCKEGTAANGFEIKVDFKDNRLQDDEGMTGMRLYCESPNDDITKRNTIHSKYLGIGSWKGHRTCPYGEWLTGFSLRVETRQGFFIDDTAANDIEMVCTRGRKFKGGGTPWGDWQKMSRCPSGKVICGLQTKVEVTASLDKVGMVSTNMHCCDPPSSEASTTKLTTATSTTTTTPSTTTTLISTTIQRTTSTQGTTTTSETSTAYVSTIDSRLDNQLSNFSTPKTKNGSSLDESSTVNGKGSRINGSESSNQNGSTNTFFDKDSNFHGMTDRSTESDSKNHESSYDSSENRNRPSSNGSNFNSDSSASDSSKPDSNFEASNKQNSSHDEGSKYGFTDSKHKGNENSSREASTGRTLDSDILSSNNKTTKNDHPLSSDANTSSNNYPPDDKSISFNNSVSNQSLYTNSKPFSSKNISDHRSSTYEETLNDRSSNAASSHNKTEDANYHFSNNQTLSDDQQPRANVSHDQNVDSKTFSNENTSNDIHFNSDSLNNHTQTFNLNPSSDSNSSHDVPFHSTSPNNNKTLESDSNNNTHSGNQPSISDKSQFNNQNSPDGHGQFSVTGNEEPSTTPPSSTVADFENHESTDSTKNQNKSSSHISDFNSDSSSNSKSDTSSSKPESNFEASNNKQNSSQDEQSQYGFPESKLSENQNSSNESSTGRTLNSDTQSSDNMTTTNNHPLSFDENTSSNNSLPDDKPASSISFSNQNTTNDARFNYDTLNNHTLVSNFLPSSNNNFSYDVPSHTDPSAHNQTLDSDFHIDIRLGNQPYTTDQSQFDNHKTSDDQGHFSVTSNKESSATPPSRTNFSYNPTLDFDSYPFNNRNISKNKSSDFPVYNMTIQTNFNDKNLSSKEPSSIDDIQNNQIPDTDYHPPNYQNSSHHKTFYNASENSSNNEPSNVDLLNNQTPDLDYHNFINSSNGYPIISASSHNQTLESDILNSLSNHSTDSHSYNSQDSTAKPVNNNSSSVNDLSLYGKDNGDLVTESSKPENISSTDVSNSPTYLNNQSADFDSTSDGSKNANSSSDHQLSNTDVTSDKNFYYNYTNHNTTNIDIQNTNSSFSNRNDSHEVPESSHDKNSTSGSADADQKFSVAAVPTIKSGNTSEDVSLSTFHNKSKESATYEEFGLEVYTNYYDVQRHNKKTTINDRNTTTLTHSTSQDFNLVTTQDAVIEERSTDTTTTERGFGMEVLTHYYDIPSRFTPATEKAVIDANNEEENTTTERGFGLEVHTNYYDVKLHYISATEKATSPPHTSPNISSETTRSTSSEDELQNRYTEYGHAAATTESDVAMNSSDNNLPSPTSNTSFGSLRPKSRNATNNETAPGESPFQNDPSLYTRSPTPRNTSIEDELHNNHSEYGHEATTESDMATNSFENILPSPTNDSSFGNFQPDSGNAANNGSVPEESPFQNDPSPFTSSPTKAFPKYPEMNISVPKSGNRNMSFIFPKVVNVNWPYFKIPVSADGNIEIADVSENGTDETDYTDRADIPFSEQQQQQQIKVAHKTESYIAMFVMSGLALTSIVIGSIILTTYYIKKKKRKWLKWRRKSKVEPWTKYVVTIKHVRPIDEVRPLQSS